MGSNDKYTYNFQGPQDSPAYQKDISGDAWDMTGWLLFCEVDKKIELFTDRQETEEGLIMGPLSLILRA